ncbi:helix-turn-helix domain-containing protein [Paenibacillus sp. DMB5]|uniref:helix-turn-helix domain-containing protein n=1 Tax=Paenibacillus sp. DMB5 TaxID=1780103 RepID=UPI00076D9A62|nr:helix-turn-helix domain-containing protein [Paenibacillus sp. DMB5]KUP22529.1 hypothetical protein AWJ19_31595 [Paenibacillus sp. DMB5]
MYPTSYFFQSDSKTPMLMLDSIGWESVKQPYAFNGLTRPDTNHVIFQYTLSGEGYIKIDGKIHTLSKETAFLVEIPGSHIYYYPEKNSDPWEFIWLNVRGPLATQIWRYTLQQDGSVIHIPHDSHPISLLWNLYRSIQEQENSQLEVNTQLFHWILVMERWLISPDKIPPGKNERLNNAINFMKERLATNLSLDEVAEYVGISKHHLCRTFVKHMNITPIEYVKRRRLERAALFLKTTDWPINRIALESGFNSASYFGKVFRFYFRVSPQVYRQQELKFPSKNLLFER